jgi:hypothetical protein
MRLMDFWYNFKLLQVISLDRFKKGIFKVGVRNGERDSTLAVHEHKEIPSLISTSLSREGRFIATNFGADYEIHYKSLI